MVLIILHHPLKCDVIFIAKYILGRKAYLIPIQPSTANLICQERAANGVYTSINPLNTFFSSGGFLNTQFC